MAKYGHFEYVVDYPIWVSIKRYWTGKLALACQNWIYCIRLKENVVYEDVVVDGDAALDPAKALLTSWWKLPVLLVGPKNSLFILCSPL